MDDCTHYEEGMLRLPEDVSLGQRVRHLALADHHRLLQHLHGEKVIGRALAAQDHLAERPLPQHLDELEHVQCLGIQETSR